MSTIFFQLYGQKWDYLLKEKNLKNFNQLNGKAEFKLKEEVLIGTSKLDTPNSFLATNKSYSDFILEFEVLIDYGLNSGVQFRSQSFKGYLRSRRDNFGNPIVYYNGIDKSNSYDGTENLIYDIEKLLNE